MIFLFCTRVPKMFGFLSWHIILSVVGGGVTSKYGSMVDAGTEFEVVVCYLCWLGDIIGTIYANLLVNILYIWALRQVYCGHLRWNILRAKRIPPLGMQEAPSRTKLAADLQRSSNSSFHSVRSLSPYKLGRWFAIRICIWYHITNLIKGIPTAMA